jgi:hypothetical protein
MIVLYYIVGGYRGMVSKFNKRITPFFKSYLEALTYKQNHRIFSESLDKGEIKNITLKLIICKTSRYSKALKKHFPL